MSVSLRPVVPEDFASIHSLQRRVEEHDRIPIVTPREEFEEWLDDPDLDLSRDTRVASVDGILAAWGRIWHRPSDAREERAYLLGGVDPDHRGKGVGSALLGWQIERATELLRSSVHDLPRYVRAQAYDFEAPALALYRRLGLEPVRYVDELLRPLDAPIDSPAPAGVELAPWSEARSDEARLVQNDAFADHWGSSPLESAAWEHLTHSFGMRLDLSFMALEDGRVVGSCRNAVFPGDEQLKGRREGWIFQVGVLRSHRKRGIATALIAASLAGFRAAGLTHSALGVDSENPTGAYGLYERMGFRPMHRSVVHQRAV